MKYNIPVNKIEKLESLINRANKKGGRISYTRGQEVICNGFLTLNVNKMHQHSSETIPIKVKCVEVQVDGCYKINDWSFLGTIEFTPNGNIIRLADTSFEGKIPDKYLHTPQICEHCGTIRYRKDTYLIHNDKTNEFKQVGSTCLLDYTKGLDAKVCASIMSCLDKVIELCDYNYGLDGLRGNGHDSVGAGLDSREVKGYAIALVKKYGYNKVDSKYSTVNDLCSVLFGQYSESDRDRLIDIEPDYRLIDSITEYANQITDKFGYMSNAKLAWLNKYIEVRDFGLIASFISVYLREQDKLEQNKLLKTEFVGNIGDKVEIKVRSVKVISSRYYEYSYSYGETIYYYEITDENRYIYLWSTSKEIKEGSIIKATIKSYTEWKGLKQTVITRGKVFKEE